MNWLYRVVKYAGLKDSLDFSSREMISILSQYTADILKPQALKLSTEISAKHRTFLAKPLDVRSQTNLIKALQKGFQFATLNQSPMQNTASLPAVQQTINNAISWHNYNPQGVQKSISSKGQVAAEIPNVSVVPKPNDVSDGPAQWIRVLGLPIKSSSDMYENPFAKILARHLGKWVQIKGNDELLVRGSKQAWEKFLHIARWYITNHAAFQALDIAKNLPDEEGWVPEEAIKGQKQFNISTDTNVISLFFDKGASYYVKDMGEIVNYIDSEIGIPISSYQVDWENGVVKFLKPKHESDQKEIAYKLYVLSNKLKDPQGWNYLSKPFNEAIEKVFGIKYGEAQQEERDNKKREKISDKTVATNLKKNLLDTPYIASRFASVPGNTMEEKLKNIYAPKQPFNKDLPYGPNNWAGLFGPETTDKQHQLQSDGVEFLASRRVGILADEPGTGKTSQAIVAADLVRENGQKILVITPNSLLLENWFGEKAKGPMYFCGHDRSQVVNISTKEELDKSVKDPNIIWIVIKNSTLKQPGHEPDDLTTAINVYSQQNIFASLIIDEIQEYKDPDNASYVRIQQAVHRSGNIPFRFGLSGTPADNTPSDIYNQLRILQHRVIQDGKGAQGGYSQDEDGFAEQFLGGIELSKIVALSRDKVKDQDRVEITDEWRQKCYSVLEWTKNLSNVSKNNIVDLFSSTFIRREKSDIKDIPLDDSHRIIVDDVPHPPKEMLQSKDWKSKVAKFNAINKCDATAQKAVQLLNADPSRQIFIASYYVEATKKIANKINELLGEGSAFAINGEIDTDQRDYYVKTFRDFGKAKNEKGQQFPSSIRALVYTLDTGAVGLNFSNCDTAIINDMDDNPSVNLQAQYRVHRVDSPKPVNVFYTQFDDSVGSAAANYDKSCFARIQQKKKINHEICQLMKKVRSVKNPQEKITLTNLFVTNTIENIILDIGFDKYTEQFFVDNLERAIHGKPIEPLSMIEVAKKKDEFEKTNHPLLPFVDEELKARFNTAKTAYDITNVIIEINAWFKSTENDIKSITNKDLGNLSNEEIKDAIRQINDPVFTSKQTLERMHKVYNRSNDDPEGFPEWFQDNFPKQYEKVLKFFPEGLKGLSVASTNWYYKRLKA